MATRGSGLRAPVAYVALAVLLVTSSSADWRTMRPGDLLALAGWDEARIVEEYTIDEAGHEQLSLAVPGVERLATVRLQPRVDSVQWYFAPPPWYRGAEPADPAAIWRRVLTLLETAGDPLPPGARWFIGGVPEYPPGAARLFISAVDTTGRIPMHAGPWVADLDVDLRGACVTHLSYSPLRWGGPIPEAVTTAGLAEAARVLGTVPDNVVAVAPAEYGQVGPGQGDDAQGWDLLAARRDWRESTEATRPVAFVAVTRGGQVGATKVLAMQPAGIEYLEQMLARSPAEFIAATLPPPAPVVERCPVWLSESTLACVSNRAHVGGPPWLRQAGAMRVDLASGEMVFMHPGWGSGLEWLTASPELLITSQRGNGLARITERANGRRYEPPVRGYYGNPSLSPDGKRLAYSRVGLQGSEDICIESVGYIERLDAIVCGIGHRIMRIDGDDRAPVFSADGTLVYFGHGVERATAEGAPPEDPAYDWSLVSVRSDAPHYATESEKVVDLPSIPRRLSVFPDGRRILADLATGLFIVDVVEKTIGPFTLPELLDPDKPEAGPLEIREPALSPDGTRIAFGGATGTQADRDKREWRIYISKLDGSELRRVTPLADGPVGFYTFPESSANAFDLEKAEWIAHAEKAQQAELERRRREAG